MSAIGTADHFALEIEPRMPEWVRTVARVNVTVPKSPSGSARQPPAPQVDGASAIHSADVVSAFVNAIRRSKLAPVVASVSVKVIAPVVALTAAAIVSPGATGSATLTDARGTSSYQAA